MNRSQAFNRHNSVSAISGSLYPSFVSKRAPSSYRRNKESFGSVREVIPNPGPTPSFQATEDNRDMEVLLKSKQLGDSINNRLYEYSTQDDGRGEWKRLTISNFTELYYNTLTGVISTTIPDGFMVNSTTQAYVPEGEEANKLVVMINTAYSQVRRCYSGPRSSSLHSMDSSTRHPRSSSSYTPLPTPFVPRMSRQNSYVSRGETGGHTENRTESSTLIQLRQILFDSMID